MLSTIDSLAQTEDQDLNQNSQRLKTRLFDQVDWLQMFTVKNLQFEGVFPLCEDMYIRSVWCITNCLKTGKMCFLQFTVSQIYN